MIEQIHRVCVANRAEIASRVFATCRRLGIETLAVYSDADAGLPFVADADAAARLPGCTPAETYLRGDLVIGLTRGFGGQAIHPGYGFLSENADFARSVVDAQLVWIGPPADVIELMGSKLRAKEVVGRAGVPVLENLTVEAATEADLPLLVKASAGGGGRGMRVVRDLADLPAEVEQAAAEAASAFGDGTVFVEPYVERGRHIEVQVLVDRYGDAVALGDRDCSIQRRHQKVLEEAPAPGLSDQVRTALHEAALAAAKAADYENAGTVEFLYDPDTERFFFLEMNTRLQVEHPVTEAVFGVDLVAAQIGIAEGRRLADVLPGLPRKPRGHAVEVRLYAEDPSADYQPQAGRLARFEIPHDVAFGTLASYGIRLDAGFASGSEVGTHYDAMLAKVVSWGPDRASALRALAGTLRQARIHGLVTNRHLLEAVLTDRDVADATMATDFLALRAEEFQDVGPSSDPELAPFIAAVAIQARRASQRTVQRGIPAGWRNVVSQPQRTEFELPGLERPANAEWYCGRDGFRHATRDDIEVLTASPSRVVLMVGSYRMSVDVHIDDVSGEVFLDDSSVVCQRLRALPRFLDPGVQVSAGSLLAPTPGTVVRVAVHEGDTVVAGSTVLVLEAMKMQHTVSASADGTVTALSVKPGDQVAAGEVLAVVSPQDSDATEGAEQ
ncbi:MAG: biotin carboxylase N-terminal domain-containing protein [Marmoricola sp.]